MAGDKAMLASSIDRAKAQYSAALELMDRLPPSPERYQSWRSVVRRLGMASAFDPFRSDLPLFERAVAMACEQHDGAGLAFASYWLAYLNYTLGESGAALHHCTAALAAAQAAGDKRLVSEVCALKGQALAARGDSAEAETLADELLAKPPDSAPGRGCSVTP